MLRLLTRRLEARALSFITNNKVIFCTVLVLSTGLFFYQSYAYVSQYLQGDVQVIITTTRNVSLPLPVVSILHKIVRSENRTSVKPAIWVQFKTHFQNNEIPLWATKLVKNSSTEQIWSGNVVNYTYVSEAIYIFSSSSNYSRNYSKFKKKSLTIRFFIKWGWGGSVRMTSRCFLISKPKIVRIRIDSRRVKIHSLGADFTREHVILLISYPFLT